MTSYGKEISPVFVIGTTRSGTSVVQLALLTTKHYRGNGEGHLSPLLLHLATETELFWESSQGAIRAKAQIAMIRKEDVLEEIYDLVRRIYRDLYGRVDFAEKTPTIDAIRVAPLLHKVWPRVKILYCRRRGLENVQSKQIKFPGASFGSSCTEWRDCMNEWNKIKASVPSYCEIDQIEIALAPRAAATRIGNYLALTDSETETIVSYFTKTHPERSGNGYEPVAIDEMPWSQADRDTFRNICDSTMMEYGYRYDRAYWNDALPADAPNG